MQSKEMLYTAAMIMVNHTRLQVDLLDTESRDYAVCQLSTIQQSLYCAFEEDDRQSLMQISKRIFELGKNIRALR